MSTKQAIYDYNVEVDLGGVTFTGPGMETKQEAEAIKNIVEQSTNHTVRVIEQ